MALFLGESVYFHREGWLKRLADAWAKFGPGMYGPFGSNLLRPHLQTTAFCTSPALLQRCPISTKDRYSWETRRQLLLALGVDAWYAGADGDVGRGI